MGFLRIGSLNVRVKKTTEAFSNFLGVGSNQHRIPPNMRSSAPPNSAYFDKVHKTWGSADNIPQVKNRFTFYLAQSIPQTHFFYYCCIMQSKKIDAAVASAMMPPPKHHSSSLHKKRRSKRQTASGFRSVPTTPNQPRANLIHVTVSEHPKTESDSDSACGFDANWKDTDTVSLPQQKSDYL